MKKSYHTIGRQGKLNEQAKHKMLFVFDKSKAQWPAINAVFGPRQPMQCCRARKVFDCMNSYHRWVHQVSL